MWAKPDSGGMGGGLLLAVAVVVLLPGCGQDKAKEGRQQSIAEAGPVEVRSTVNEDELGAAADHMDGQQRLTEQSTREAGQDELAGLPRTARGDAPEHDPQELFDAIERRDHSAVRVWIDGGGSVDVRGLSERRQRLMQARRDAPGVPADLETPLIAAARIGDATLVRLLLEQGADANIPIGSSRRFAMDQAVWQNINLPVMQLLLERTDPGHLPGIMSRSSLEQMDPLTGMPGIMSREPSSWRDFDCGMAMALLLHYADGHFDQEQARSLIASAVSSNSGRADVLEVFLLRFGSEPELRDPLRESSSAWGSWDWLAKSYNELESAAWQRRATYFFALIRGDQETVSQLLGDGADPNQRFLAVTMHMLMNLPVPREVIREESVQNARPALHIAAALGHVGVIELLIEAGAQVDDMDSFGATALQLAVFHGQTQAARALLAAGADLELRTFVALNNYPYGDLQGNYDNPLFGTTWLAVRRGWLETVQWLIEYDRGRDARRLGNDALSGLLVQAVGGRHTELAGLLIDQGAQPYGRSVLELAGDGEVHLLRLLLEAGTDVEVSDEQGCRPLHLAAKAGSAKTVQLLLEYGAEVEPRDVAGKVPRQYATEEGHDDIVTLLLEASHQRAADESVDR